MLQMPRKPKRQSQKKPANQTAGDHRTENHSGQHQPIVRQHAENLGRHALGDRATDQRLRTIEESTRQRQTRTEQAECHAAYHGSNEKGSGNIDPSEESAGGQGKKKQQKPQQQRFCGRLRRRRIRHCGGALGTGNRNGGYRREGRSSYLMSQRPR